MSTPSTAPSPSNKLLVGVLILLIVILAVLAFAIRLFGFSFQTTPTLVTDPSRHIPSPPVPIVYPAPYPTDSTTTVPSPSEQASNYHESLRPRLINLEQQRRDYKNQLHSTREKIEIKTFNVAWQKPVKVSSSTVLGETSTERTLTPFVVGPYLRGEMTEGPFKGAKLYTGETVCDGMCFQATTQQLWLVDGDKRVPLDPYFYPKLEWVPYSSDILAQAYGLPTTNGNAHLVYTFTRPTVPLALQLTNGKTVFVDQEADGTITEYGKISSNCWSDGCKGYRMATTTKEGFVIYEVIDSYFDIKYILTEDGALHSVRSAIPFDAYDEARFNPVISTTTLKWTGIYATNTANYMRYYVGGCGGISQDNVMTTKEIKSSDLILAGKTASGESLYTIRDPYGTHPEIQRAYDNWFFYDNAGEKPSVEEFLRQRPVPLFIWKNAFGENIRYVLSDGVPVAECGKPVIYLYPEKTTPVHVALGPNIKVTVSEPIYPREGWNVVAEPDGQLTYQGKNYGSLFWEGTGVDYAVPSEGFLLKDGEVDHSLQNILARYGLNVRESQEFRDFWVPLMTGSPYYRVSFVTTKDWNKAAPLSVTPAPKTVLRIFMDWEKLDRPLSIKPPQITPFVRTGFTLVEWGGLLRK